MNRVAAVLFDLDQTLLDRSASLQGFATWQATRMLRADLDDPEGFVARLIELDANGTVWKDEVYATLREEFALAGWSVAELLASYELCFCAFSRPREGAASAVRALAERGTRLALVSNGRAPFQERNFRALGFPDAFDAVVVSAAVGLRKPDARIFEHACTLLGVAPADVVFVGDDPVADMEGARAAGLRTVHVPPESTRAVCAAADIRVEHLRDLMDAIDALD